MRRALELARQAWGRTHPNPMVGAVLACNGRILGEGWHKEFGGPHAEVNAIKSAGLRRKRGGVLYVTLEQAIERAGAKQGNKGADAAMSAIEMANLFRNI